MGLVLWVERPPCHFGNKIWGRKQEAQSWDLEEGGAETKTPGIPTMQVGRPSLPGVWASTGRQVERNWGQSAQVGGLRAEPREGLSPVSGWCLVPELLGAVLWFAILLLCLPYIAWQTKLMVLKVAEVKCAATDLCFGVWRLLPMLRWFTHSAVPSAVGLFTCLYIFPDDIFQG